MNLLPFLLLIGAGSAAVVVLLYLVHRLRQRIRLLEASLEASRNDADQRTADHGRRFDHLEARLGALDIRRGTGHLADLVRLGRRSGQLSPSTADELLAYLADLSEPADDDGPGTTDEP
jgi:hypothetical protein